MPSGPEPGAACVIVPLDLDEPAVSAEVLRLQRAAYAVEAALIGDDRIPPLHEDEEQLRAAGLQCLGSWCADDTPACQRLAGAVAWVHAGEALDVHRLVVDPTQVRRGVGRALVAHLLATHPDLPAVVSTGRDNVPARRLYEGLGFREGGTVEALPGLWVVGYALSR